MLFSTFSWRFLRSKNLYQSQLKLEKLENMTFNKTNLRRVGFLLWRFLVRVDLVRRNDSVVCRCNCHVPRQNNACKMKNKILCTLFNFHISKKNMLCDEWGKVINSKWHRLCTSASAKLAKIVAIPKNHFLYSITST